MENQQIIIRLDKIEKSLLEIREKLSIEVSGINTALASEKSLAKNWLTSEEDEAWKYLEKEI